jgi:radical SAM protein with 4Fe4S-binding SPASM domain
MSSDEWTAALRQIASDFVARDIMLAFTGGEPLLKEGFLDILDEVSALGFRFGTVTNGTLLNESRAKRLAATRIGSISISLDAPPEVNDELRGKGVAKKIEAGIENLRAAGYKGKLEIISTITKPAVAQLEAMRRYISTLKIGLWRVVPVIPIGRAAEKAELLVDSEDIRQMLDFVREARKDGLLPTPEFGEECYLGDEYERRVRPYKYQCRAGLTVGGILHDGRIGACPELADCFVQGDIRKERFRDVWDHRYEVFRDRAWTRRGACSTCDAFSACQGGSLHLYPSLKSEPVRCFYLMLDQSHSSAQNTGSR